MTFSDHHHETAEERASCAECGALRDLFASIEPGPVPADLRGQIREAIAAEPAPQVRPADSNRMLKLASGVAAALLLGILLAPSIGEWSASTPEPWASMPGAAMQIQKDQPVASDLAVRLGRAADGVVLEWENGHGEYVVEKSDRPDAWEQAEQVAVHGAAWQDPFGASSTLTFYRVRPVDGSAQ